MTRYSNDEKVTVDCRVERETPKAYLMDVGLAENVWLPKSQVKYDEANGKVEVPEWLAIEKGMENL